MSSEHLNDKTFEITGFRHTSKHRVVRSLTALFKQANLPASVTSRRLQHHPKIVIADRLRTGTRDQYPAGMQQTEPTKVHFFVSGQGMWHGFFATRERRRIENDQVIPLIAPFEHPQLLKGVGLTIATTWLDFIVDGMGLSQRHGRRTHIQPVDRLSPAQCSLYTERAGMAKGFQDCFPFGERSRRQSILSLIAEPSGFLPLGDIHFESGIPS